MDRLANYRQIVQDLLMKHGGYKLSHGDIETEVIFDQERDRYQVVHVGWDGDQFIHVCVSHVDIKGGKVWIQWNSLEDDIAADLVALGIPKEDIVIALHPPEMRKFTEYAVG
jgi:hypothetical protein